MTNKSTSQTNYTAQEIEIQAAVFRRLLAHLDEHKEVQNIDLMITAGFCRNCFSKWTVSEAEKLGVKIDIDSAREQIYGMPYSQWKTNHQLPATDEQMAAFNSLQKK
ncbi:MAG: deoxycytidine triphosphate deaminase [Gammaproteobacteria bacterium]|nr:MAG: deoxycytidine triphosphate deaminase [Gammaproteobacteria bacterium]